MDPRTFRVDEHGSTRFPGSVFKSNFPITRHDWRCKPYAYSEEPFVALLETSTFGSPGGGKESVYRLYLVTTVWYFTLI